MTVPVTDCQVISEIAERLIELEPELHEYENVLIGLLVAARAKGGEITHKDGADVVGIDNLAIFHYLRNISEDHGGESPCIYRFDRNAGAHYFYRFPGVEA